MHEEGVSWLTLKVLDGVYECERECGFKRFRDNSWLLMVLENKLLIDLSNLGTEFCWDLGLG